jgi:hypothetical protein
VGNRGAGKRVLGGKDEGAGRGWGQGIESAAGGVLCDRVRALTRDGGQRKGRRLEERK